MKTEIVKAADNRRESLAMLIATILIIAVCGSIIAKRQRDDSVQVIQETQISVFKELNTYEQGTYNDLLTAAAEIEMMIHDNKDEGAPIEWPSVEYLVQEYIPPFVKDTAWEARGALEWSRRVVQTGTASNKSICAFFGSPSNSEESGSFLLLLFGDHKGKEQMQIWYNRKTGLEFPKSFKANSLGFSGWLKAVPYTGGEELKKLNRS